MSRRVIPASLLLVAIAAVPAAAQSGGGLDLSPGPSYQQGNAPTSETDAFDPQHGFLAPSTQVPQEKFNWWFYRVAGDSVQRPFGSFTKSDGYSIFGTSSYPHFPPGGTVSTYNWTEIGPSGVRFTAAYVATLSGSASGFDSRLDQSFQISNPNAAPLTISLYNQIAWTPGNQSLGDFAAGNLNTITVTDGTYLDSQNAVGASAFQAATDATLQNLLFGGPAQDLNDSGLPIAGNGGPDLISTAFEWTFTVPANGTMTVQSALATAAGVPEPGTLMLTISFAIGVTALRLSRQTAKAKSGANGSSLA